MKKFFSLLLSLLSFLTLSGISPALAASITSSTDTLSASSVSSASNHTISFITPTGLSTNQTAILTFPAGFSMGSTTYTDVDVRSNGTDQTLGATSWTEIHPSTISGTVILDQIASDSSGSNLFYAYATSTGGRLYTSTTSGATWVERQPIGSVSKIWHIASDSTGANLMAADGGPGRLYTSTTSGATWAESRPAGDNNKSWIAVASDSDGSNLMAADGGPGRLYTSTTSGATWVERQPAGNNDEGWVAIASDSTGVNLMAAVAPGRLYVSTTSGATWAESRPVGNIDDYWQGLASNSDGSKLFATNGTDIFVSADKGSTWSTKTPSVSGFWYFISSDSSGDNVVAGTSGNRLYTSSNSGTTWTERMPAGNRDWQWYSGGFNSDGSKLAVSAKYGYVYTSSNSGQTFGLSVSTSTRAVTLTSDLGTIPAGATVTFKIGTNASYGSTGVNQITNPSTSGNYNIAVSGTFGDSGNIPVSINPASISDLSCMASGQAGANFLSWTVPAGIISSGSGYTGQYHQGNSITWNGAGNTTFGTSWTRKDSGSSDQQLVTGLNPNTQYSFILHALGNSSTESFDSNTVTCYAPSSAPSSFSQDSTPPTSKITSPSSNSSFPTSKPITISGTVQDTGGSSVQSVEISTDNGVTWNPASLSSNTTWTYTWTPTKEGTYTIQSRAYDWLGNRETPSSGITLVIGTSSSSSGTSSSSTSATQISSSSLPFSSPSSPDQIRADIAYLQNQLVLLLQRLLSMLREGA